MPPSDQARWFEEEVRPCESILRGYLQRRFPSLQDYDDVIQETYIRLWRAVTQRHVVSVKGFLFVAARNVAIDRLRHQRIVSHEAISEMKAMPLLEDAPDVAVLIERQQRRDLLGDALASLSERCREVVMLRHLEGLTYNEIAGLLGISPNTVKIHLVKGVKDCGAFYRKHGLLETAATRHRSAGKTEDASE